MSLPIVTGSILDVKGNSRITSIVFMPLGTPFISGNALVTTTRPIVRTAIVGGAFSLTLEPGQYSVVIGVDTVKITVPNDTVAHNFVDLLS